MKKKFIILVSLLTLTSCGDILDFKSSFNDNYFLDNNLVFNTTDRDEFDTYVMDKVESFDIGSIKKVEYYNERPYKEGLIPDKTTIDLSNEDNYYYLANFDHIGAIWEIKRSGDGYVESIYGESIDLTVEEGNETISNEFIKLVEQFEINEYSFGDSNSESKYYLYESGYFKIIKVDHNDTYDLYHYSYYLDNGLLSKYEQVQIKDGESTLKVYEYFNYYY